MTTFMQNILLVDVSSETVSSGVTNFTVPAGEYTEINVTFFVEKGSTVANAARLSVAGIDVVSVQGSGADGFNDSFLITVESGQSVVVQSTEDLVNGKSASHHVSFKSFKNP